MPIRQNRKLIRVLLEKSQMNLRCPKKVQLQTKLLIQVKGCRLIVSSWWKRNAITNQTQKMVKRCLPLTGHWIIQLRTHARAPELPHLQHPFPDPQLIQTLRMINPPQRRLLSPQLLVVGALAVWNLIQKMVECLQLLPQQQIANQVVPVVTSFQHLVEDLLTEHLTEPLNQVMEHLHPAIPLQLVDQNLRILVLNLPQMWINTMKVQVRAQLAKNIKIAKSSTPVAPPQYRNQR